MYSGVKYADAPVLDTKPAETTSRPTAKLPQSASFSDEPTKESKRRADWQANHLRIEQAMLMMLRKSVKLPTNLQLAEATGLSERAIRNHLENLDLSEMFTFARRQYAPLADEVMKSITRQAMSGTGRAQELYFGLVFGWRRGQTLELKTPELETPEERQERIEKMTADIFRRHDAEVQALLALSPDVLYTQIHANKNDLLHVLREA